MATSPGRRRPLSPEQKADAQAAPYEAGFGKPPKSSQFQKGQSGNPSGRPKGARALKTDLLEVLDFELMVQLPDGPQRVSMQRAMVLSTCARAAKGDARSAMLMLRMMELATPERLKDAADPVKLDPAEKALLSKMMSDFGVGDESASNSGDDEISTEGDSAASLETVDEPDWNII